MEVPSAKTLAEVFQHLASQHPGFHERICTTDGRLRESVLIFVNDRQVHKENMYQTQLMDGARIMVVPSIAGG